MPARRSTAGFRGEVERQHDVLTGPIGVDKRRTVLRRDELNREIEVLRDRLARMSEAMLRINESLDLDTVLNEVLDSACSLTGAKYGTIVLHDQDRLRDAVSYGVSPEVAEQFCLLPETPAYFEHFRKLRRPVRTADFSKYTREVNLPQFDNVPPVRRDTTFLGAPLRHRGGTVGTFLLAEKKGGLAFTPADEETLVVFASQASLVISNARRYREEQTARSGLQTLIDTSPVGVALFDIEKGVPLLFNQEATRIMENLMDPGQSPIEILSEMTIRRSDAQDIDLQQVSLADALGRRETLRAEEIVLEVPDGRSVRTLVNASPVFLQDGGGEAMFVTIQDMTPLEHLEQLRAQFLGMVSHELRAPLTSIKGSAATVLGSPSSLGAAEMMQFFRIIDQQADHLNGLINDLLDVAHIDSGTLSVRTEPTELAALVDEARNLLLGGGAKVDVRVYIPPDLPMVMADARRVVQVLNNLLSNARRHSYEASVVRISAECEDFQVAISVSDDGHGVSSDRLPHLFRKFSSMAGGDPASRGSGLGLAICKGIVEAHGGRIWAESDGPGLGSKFTFTLPAVQGAGYGVSDGMVPGSRSQGLGEEQIRFLAVDDDPHTLRFLRDTLSKSGMEPILTGDPGEALHLMGKEPHLVLLDLMLPGTDGLSLMHRIRERSDVPVIFLSAYGQEEVVARALNMGAADYIIKPFSPTELEARVRAALRKHAATEFLPPYEFADLTINYGERSVALAGRQLKLTSTEYRLLSGLASNAGRVLTYGRLMRDVWGTRDRSDVRPMRTVISNLRRKLGDDADHPTYIFTVPRVGYRMAKPTG